MDLVRSFGHPDEVYALLKYKFSQSSQSNSCNSHESDTMGKCYAYLKLTSRSFAAVIQCLDPELRDVVCIFYLVLRALDTVEDDMTIEHTTKVELLTKFHTFLQDPVWRFTKSNEKDKIVLEDFPVISAEFRSLKPVYQEVISDICSQMGTGMTLYLDKSPDSISEYDQYCHYVAGLVGVGLSRLFVASNLEDGFLTRNSQLSNSMGLFLQKTNIIRDYHEDLQQGRIFWPRQIWSKYAAELKDLSLRRNELNGVRCLNELITNALGHIPDVIEYLSHIHNQTIFNFCAIPQVMAIATLHSCYHNASVMRGVVKLRKGETVRLMMRAKDIDSVKAIFGYYCTQIKRNISRDDPLSISAHHVVEVALRESVTVVSYSSSTVYLPIYVSLAMLVTAIVWKYWTELDKLT